MSPLVVLTVTTEDLFRRFAECVIENSWSDKGVSLVNELDALAREDIKGIRKMFEDGYAPMLLPSDLFDALDACFTQDKNSPVVIHIIDRNNNLLGAITTNEIRY